MGQSRRAVTKPEGTEGPALETSPARILVVDDDSRNLLTISEVLKGVGEIHCARSGEEALRYASVSVVGFYVVAALLMFLASRRIAETWVEDTPQAG